MIEPIKVKINEGEILILKTNMLLRSDDLERIRINIAQQRKSGIITIPNGFEYEIVHVKEEK